MPEPFFNEKDRALGETGWMQGTPSRQPWRPKDLVGIAGGVAVASYASVRWLQQALNCTEAQAIEFKINAQYDFDNLIAEAKRAWGKMA